MQINPGEIIEGKVTGITKYGAFVNIDGKASGMIHISEIASGFIKDINDILQVNQTVKAVVIGVNENGKLALSVKQLPENINITETAEPVTVKPNAPAKNIKNIKNIKTAGFEKPEEFVRSSKNTETPANFEDMISKFKRESDEKISDLKFLEPKRSGQPRRRKD